MDLFIIFFVDKVWQVLYVVNVLVNVQYTEKVI